MKQFFSLLTAICIVLSSQAQSGANITGSIKDGGNQKVVDAATISLLQSKDSALVKATIADQGGSFSFENVKEGTYLILATSIGHNKTYSQPISVNTNSTTIHVGVIQLTPADKNLKEVVVVSKKPFIERKLDKTIVNVDAAITNSGNTAMEVLEKSPGVTVDKDGNISLKGKQGVIIMLDGKPTYMSSQALANFLQSLPASNLDQIEIMTNPSAKYDASGNSGVINIKTKKNKQKGMNGTVNLAYIQGIYSNTRNSFNINYRNNKFNAFATLSGNYGNNFQDLDILRKYINQDKTLRAIFEQNSFEVRHRNNYNIKIGTDYYASKKTTLGIVFTGYTTPGVENGENTSYLKNSTGVVDSIITAHRREKSTWQNIGVNINMRHVLDSAGREITADIDYLNYHSKQDQHFINRSYNPDWTIKYADELRGILPSDINVYSAKIDYTHPLKNNVKIESGVKASYVETDNTAGYYNVVNGTNLPDYEKTNRFVYKENINAVYLNFSKEMKKWSVQAGLRLENTNYSGHQFGNPQRADSAFKRSYTNLFPTIYVSYNASEKNQFGFSVGRRINRPDYEDLNPFLFFLDKYTFEAGNPFLKPMYSNVVEISHTYKQFLTTTLNYSHTKDLFNETFEQQDFATIVRQGNYGIANRASLSVNAQIPVQKWWTMIAYAEEQYNHFKGKLYGNDVDVKGATFLVNINNQFKFKKGWSAELSGFYRSKGVEGQLIIKPMGQVSVGIQKQVLKNKATLRLNVRDIFFTQFPRGNINFQNTEASFRQTRDSRTVTFGFNYRFGKPIKGVPKRKTGGAGEEQDRIKSGGN